MTQKAVRLQSSERAHGGPIVGTGVGSPSTLYAFLVARIASLASFLASIAIAVHAHPSEQKRHVKGHEVALSHRRTHCRVDFAFVELQVDGGAGVGASVGSAVGSLVGVGVSQGPAQQVVWNAEVSQGKPLPLPGVMTLYDLTFVP